MLKRYYEKKEDIPQGQEGFYTESNGKWLLQVDGMIPKEKLDEFRETNVELQRKLELYKNIDPAKYQEAQNELQRLKEEQLKSEGKIEELLTLKTSEYMDAINKKDALIGSLRGEINNGRIERTIMQSIDAATVKDGNLRFILADANRNLGVDEKGNVFVRDAEGKTRTKDDGSALSISDYLADYAKGEGKGLFRESTGSGSAGSETLMVGGKVNVAAVSGKEVSTDVFDQIVQGKVA